MDINDGLGHLAKLLSESGSDSEMSETPVPLDEFLYSRDYLRCPPLSEVQYGFVEALSDIYKGCKYTEVVAEWGKGGGKDFVCACSLARIVYLLWCLKDPAGYYGLKSGSQIDALNIAVNAEQANDVFFVQFANLIDGAPIFKKVTYNAKGGRINFPKNISAISGHSEMEGMEGHNVIVAILDEIDAFKTEQELGGNRFRKAKSAKFIYDRMRTSGQSRFPGIAKVASISFPRFAGSFIQQRRTAGLKEEHTYVSAPEGVPTWVANPLRTREDFDDEFKRDPEMAAMMYECISDAPIIRNNDLINISEANDDDILYRFKRRYSGEAIRIKPKYLPERTITPEHPVLVRSSNWKKNRGRPSVLGEPKWKMAKDLVVSDYVVVRRPKFDYEPSPINPTKELMRLCGLYVSEKFTCHEREVGMMEEVVRCFREVFNRDVRYVISCNEGFLRFSRMTDSREHKRKGTDIKRFFAENFGEHSRDARLPKWLFCLDEDLRREFLKYCYLGDGCKAYNRWTYTSFSWKLRFDLWLFVQGLGGFASWQNGVNMRWIGESCEHPGIFKACMFSDEDNFYTKISELEVVNIDEDVYNIATKSEEYSIPFVVHNCKPPLARDVYFRYPHFILTAFGAVLDGYEVKYDQENPHPVMEFVGYEPPMMVPKEDSVYFIHIDSAKNRDRCGFAMVCYDGRKLRIPLVTGFKAPVNGEIDFESVRNIVKKIAAMGFLIRKVTYDGWQSVESIQQLQKEGFDAGTLSVKKPQYDSLKDIIYASNATGCYDQLLVEELITVELLGGKVIDHKVGGSNDIADAVAGATFSALQNLGCLPDIKLIGFNQNEEETESEEDFDKRVLAAIKHGNRTVILGFGEGGDLDDEDYLC